MKKRVGILLVSMVACLISRSQTDTVKVKTLDSVSITSFYRQLSIQPLPAVHGAFIVGGKKSEVIDMQLSTAVLPEKTGRQLFAKVPGVFIYDMDGAGNQINIATRGLDPHRGWEFNIRKDGMLTNSDMYGYPASHYSMPLESIERIELIRGTGSLQYGAQFGGVLNYVTKKGDTTRPFSFESINSVGSFHLLSSYNAIGGKVNRFTYYAYYNKKSRDGYRDNEHTSSSSHDIILQYDFSARFSVRAEWARSEYLYQMAGPLTDAQFRANPRQSTRSRNYFNPDINVPSIQATWKATPNTRIELTSSAVIGKRNSVMYDKPTNIPDTINPLTLQYNNRQVDIDAFNSYTSEVKVLQQYRLLNRFHYVVAGVQYMNNDLHRTQLGKGTTGTDFDLTLVQPGWGRDVHLKTTNWAAYAENSWQVLRNLTLTGGVRIESGETRMSGTINYYPSDKIPVSIGHHFPLFGAGFLYKIGEYQLYGGWSQAYHPMLFKDLIPSSTLEKVDPAIKDADGFNAELGFRGKWKFLRWDVTGYLLRINNRFGTLAETDNNGDYYSYRTNIGNSLSKGVEMYVEANWLLHNKIILGVFTSTSIAHARYLDAVVKSGNNNINIKGNKVESAPDFTTRNGASLRVNRMALSVLWSFTAETYADALNTVNPPATSAVGKVPSYSLVDLSGSVRINQQVSLKANISNLFNKQYFTKRPMFYPGPGIWPSDGRNMSATVSFKF